MKVKLISALCLTLFLAASATAEKYYLLVGVDARHYPGPQRMLMPDPGPGTPGPVYDGDRLAGTADIGPVVPYVGTGSPMYDPNYLGSLSMLYRRGTIPFAGGIPILGVEFLGGPLLDLDGDLNNGQRSFVPVPPNKAIEIPGTDSFIELDINLVGRTVELLEFDASGCNEGGPNIGPDIATILVTIAGTGPLGEKTGAINPGVDTRVGTVGPFMTDFGVLPGVYLIQDLGFELWEDSIDPFTSSANVLGTMQHLGALGGYLIERDPHTGQFPILTGAGLGSTRWPDVDTDQIGNVFKTANGLAGGNATITRGVGGDHYDSPGNGGLPLNDFNGDLGAYLDAVVIPRLPAAADRLVYLESTGFGINNSFDPVYTDTIGYDAVIIAATASCGIFEAGDINCDVVVGFGDINPFIAALAGGEPAWKQHTQSNDCTYLCVCDINRDGSVDFGDINPFIELLVP